jgi:4-hydroxy-4-methyl-2-oxoglutarate aldolase
MTSGPSISLDLKARLHSPVLSDALDAIGLGNQALDPSIRPLDESLVLTGRVRTGRYMEVFHVEAGENPYELEMKLVDDLRPGDVALLCCSGSKRITPWGELLTTASIARGAAGCVTDGMVRDTRTIQQLQFPVFHRGVSPLDAQGRGKVVAIDVPVECGGVKAVPGNIIFGDADGLVLIPAEAAKEVIARAVAKVSQESNAHEELRKGALLRDVFSRHHVL